MLILSYKPVHPAARMPTYGSAGAARFDLAAVEGGTIEAGAARTFRTGLTVAVPEGYELQIVGRSGLGFKYGVRLANVVGIVDADFRGEVMIRLHNDGPIPYTVADGERIAQAKLAPAEVVAFVPVAALPETVRGAQGFGSTGR